VGSGDYRYRVNADWAKLPDGWSFKKVGGVDSHDNVYVFNRAQINPQALTTMRRCQAGSSFDN
jgi:hypothetical protein